jgi:NAD(P)-dependent dehydrogenase (short-subunit alcohol dehydrogenase family)
VRNLRGRVAVVTGAANGIGLDLAVRFLKEGMDVVIADTVADDLAHAEETLRPLGNVLAVETDVSSRESVQRLADASVDRFGAVHVLCNNAGIGGFQRLATISLATWDWTVRVNLLGILNGSAVFLPILARQEEGYIVNTASISGFVTAAYLEPYGVSKACVVSLSESLAAEFAAEYPQIGVAVLCPAQAGICTDEIAQLVIDGMAARKTHIFPQSRPASLMAAEGPHRHGAQLPAGGGWPWIRIDSSQ